MTAIVSHHSPHQPAFNLLSTELTGIQGERSDPGSGSEIDSPPRHTGPPVSPSLTPPPVCSPEGTPGLSVWQRNLDTVLGLPPAPRVSLRPGRNPPGFWSQAKMPSHREDKEVSQVMSVEHSLLTPIEALNVGNGSNSDSHYDKKQHF